VPWLFDDESVKVMRRFARLKNRLFPYLFATAHEARERGWPAMRAMVLEFPDDPACLYLDRQYMLGSSLLVAPVFRRDHVAEYYLPRGRWTSLLTGKTVEGGQWRIEVLDFMHVPLFVKQNTILAMSGNVDQPRWRFNDELVLNLFQIRDGADLALTVPSSERGEGATSFHCRRSGERVALTCDGRARNVKLLLRSCKSVARVTNGRTIGASPEGEGLLIDWARTDEPITLEGIGRPAPAPELQRIISHARDVATVRH
jgi:alpha-D-xyloside xylohydrolase